MIYDVVQCVKTTHCRGWTWENQKEVLAQVIDISIYQVVSQCNIHLTLGTRVLSFSCSLNTETIERFLSCRVKEPPISILLNCIHMHKDMELINVNLTLFYYHYLVYSLRKWKSNWYYCASAAADFSFKWNQKELRFKNSKYPRQAWSKITKQNISNMLYI